ncbi:39S ribosomal protein L2, mitochondrial isoform X2 [Macrosteles quadrilineatus]|uniref:39S ribosomal protein L2, mitochondrial isoform X2 n=1 Tax=Macrosteles quadrilineatus TaxID=74068 RepID=UPI0023E33B67|nr:39S ribosomal protein L2, mitochondrial isoform X2 [Macrosteles quadrilineatus]
MALSFCKKLQKLSQSCSEQFIWPLVIQTRNRMGPPIKRHHGFDQPDLPKPSGKFWRKVEFPEKYTVKPLEVKRLGGRDPETGRKVINRVGGGLKYKYLWVHWKREGPKEGPPLVEKVVQIVDSWCHSAFLALVASGKQMKYYFATENMKPGDLIKTSMNIPRIPVNPNEGDAYPLGALPMGTKVHSVERLKGTGGFYAHAAGVSATILRLVSSVVHQLTLPCFLTVSGQLSSKDVTMASPKLPEKNGRQYCCPVTFQA